jgi:hypothetical protein
VANTIEKNSQSTTDEPASLAQVLYREFLALRPRWLDGVRAPAGQSAEETERCRSLQEIYARAGQAGGTKDRRLSALCLSGGGIRSATFNLGVLQALARCGMMGSFDYLSSVSGGGYIASWLRTWMYREGTAGVIAQLEATKPAGSPLTAEPTPIANLRVYSNYLTPQLGLFSGDTWSAAAIIVRNLILNWLVIVPVLVLAVGIPQLFLLVVKSDGLAPSWNQCVLYAALLMELMASISVYYHRRFVKQPGVPQARFILSCVLPICLASGLLSTAALNLGLDTPDAGPVYSSTQLNDMWRFALIWCIAIPLLGWALNELWSVIRPATEPAGLGRDRADPSQRFVSMIFELLALIVSGAVTAWLLVTITKSWFSAQYEHPACYVIFVLPALLGLYLIARTLFVGLASLGDGVLGRVRSGSSDDADREWWARLSGWVLLVTVSWTVVTSICLFGSYLPGIVDGFSKEIKGIVATLGALSGAIAAFTGSSAKTPAAANVDVQQDSAIHKWVLAAMAPVFTVCVIIVMSWIASELGEIATRAPAIFKWPSPITRLPQVAWSTSWSYFFMLLALGVYAVIAGRIVNVNKFSLHGMYRNRIVRAYLGASNDDRHPDPFTGFSSADNPGLHELWREAGPAIAARPLPIINTTLNLVQGGENLAWQERKAESFSMTPFYCGNWREGYRSSQDYGGYGGISVGTAVAISGAAANPNMGFSSSPALGFLMAIFNVRLGAWLGNTNSHGRRTFRFSGPRQAIVPIFAEMFGLTNSRRRYVNLSDGGHFDNLGLYEVVLRRCRHIVVSDAGQDGSYAFEDLGNAIRKIRIDLGIPIEFEHKIEILPNLPDTQGLYCAQAVVRYSAVDGTDSAQDGSLVYFKPTLHGRGVMPIPYDVFSYARSHPQFPHESTADQWFSESQFESYRALGAHAVMQVSGGTGCADFEMFLANIREYLDKKDPQP